MSETESVSVEFTKSELWLLQATVRHEMAAQDTWHMPPVSRSLNQKVADALLFCEDQNQSSAGMMLTLHDCLVIDYVVPQNAKDATGTPIGQNVLFKAFRIRSTLLYGAQSSVDVTDPYEKDQFAWRQRLEQHKKGLSNA